MAARVTRTTVYLDATEYRRIKEIARRRGRTPAALIREAVQAYTDRHAPRPRPKSIGIGRSGRGDVAERADELLAGFGSDR
jgi:predicted transcriptional regulator